MKGRTIVTTESMVTQGNSDRTFEEFYGREYCGENTVTRFNLTMAIAFGILVIVLPAMLLFLTVGIPSESLDSDLLIPGIFLVGIPEVTLLITAIYGFLQYRYYKTVTLTEVQTVIPHMKDRFNTGNYHRLFFDVTVDGVTKEVHTQKVLHMTDCAKFSNTPHLAGFDEKHDKWILIR